MRMTPPHMDRFGSGWRKLFYEVIFEPETPAAVVMILGYGIIAVPTGIVTAEFSQARKDRIAVCACPGCGAGWHALDALYCRHCGEYLKTYAHEQAETKG